MIKFENTQVYGWKEAIRGMRNPLNSWDKIDSYECDDGCDKMCPYYHRECGDFYIGENDLSLMTKLRKAGTDHRKFLRMIGVYVDITAPLYYWKEFDTYKVSTISNSCSTMHKIMSKEFELDDFSHEHLTDFSLQQLKNLISYLNLIRNTYLIVDKEKKASKNVWWQAIQLLPSSYNQKRTVFLNYEVLNNMYHSRKNHKLDEWSIGFCNWVESLPYAQELIIGE